MFVFVNSFMTAMCICVRWAYECGVVHVLWWLPSIDFVLPFYCRFCIQGVPIVNVDETHPYSTRPVSHYVSTKAEAEKLVLKSNGSRTVRSDGSSGVLLTAAVRPASFIFGYQDKVVFGLSSLLIIAAVVAIVGVALCYFC